MVALEAALAAAERSVAHTVLERAFLRLVDRHGLPPPTGQVWVRLPSGHRRLDFLYEAHGVVVELFSQRWHSTRAQRRADAQRLAELHAKGLRVRAFL